VVGAEGAERRRARAPPLHLQVGVAPVAQKHLLAGLVGGARIELVGALALVKRAVAAAAPALARGGRGPARDVGAALCRGGSFAGRALCFSAACCCRPRAVVPALLPPLWRLAAAAAAAACRHCRRGRLRHRQAHQSLCEGPFTAAAAAAVATVAAAAALVAAAATATARVRLRSPAIGLACRTLRLCRQGERRRRRRRWRAGRWQLQRRDERRRRRAVVEQVPKRRERAGGVAWKVHRARCHRRGRPLPRCPAGPLLGQACAGRVWRAGARRGALGGGAGSVGASCEWLDCPLPACAQQPAARPSPRAPPPARPPTQVLHQPPRAAPVVLGPLDRAARRRDRVRRAQRGDRLWREAAQRRVCPGQLADVEVPEAGGPLGGLVQQVHRQDLWIGGWGGGRGQWVRGPARRRPWRRRLVPSVHSCERPSPTQPPRTHLVVAQRRVLGARQQRAQRRVARRARARHEERLWRGDEHVARGHARRRGDAAPALGEKGGLDGRRGEAHAARPGEELGVARRGGGRRRRRRWRGRRRGGGRQRRRRCGRRGRHRAAVAVGGHAAASRSPRLHGAARFPEDALGGGGARPGGRRRAEIAVVKRAPSGRVRGRKQLICCFFVPSNRPGPG
jgi:hypothetical protein